MAGWRPHTDQVGQTGTKISPEVYIPCGISGATQHMAGCKGAKKVLAINNDAEAPILAGADYAVIGDVQRDRAGDHASCAGSGRADGGDARERGRARRRARRRGHAFARRSRRSSAAAHGQAAGDRARRRVPDRMRQEAVVVLGQRKLLQRSLPGVMHALIFWGFLVLFPTILMAMIAIVDRDATLPWLGEQAGSRCCSTSSPCWSSSGCATALWIRKVLRPARFEGSHLGEADLILALISGIVITLLLWHASRIALGLNEYDAGAAPTANLLSGLFGDGTVTEVLERVFVWAHVLLILGFLAYLPTLQAPAHHRRGAQRLPRATRARGRLEPLRFDDDIPEEDMRFGIGTVEDLDVETDDGLVLLHGVRALPGRLPGLRNRQAPCRPSC